MPLILPPGDFKAYLFDCDGTIADSMPLHYIAWTRALAEWGAVFPEDLYYAWGGRPVQEIIVSLNQMQHLDMPPALVAERKEEFYLELLPQVKAVPEVLEHVLEAHGRIPTAVVSGSPREAVQATLVALGILDRFDTLVCAGDYTRGKPDPEPFLMAAARLGVPPADCLVFEDAALGIESATRAGMASVKVPGPLDRAGAAQLQGS
jgi:HAD superfamily hydrolase (TIGR01509 family)